MAAVERQRVVVTVAVLLDLLAVSLVVPLLPVRFRELGMSQRAYGLIASTYSAAQIVGGLALGALSDRGLGRRGLLLLNFVGAAVSYAIVGTPGATLPWLVASRVVVGLCKQTTTASTALMTDLTDPGAERILWIGRISSAAQVSWIAGQSLGGVLNAWGDARYPAAAAVFLYAIDFGLVRATLPAAGAIIGPPQPPPKEEEARRSPPDHVDDTPHLAPLPSSSMRDRFRQLVASPDVANVVAVRTTCAFVQRSTGGARTLYELERWDLSRADIAYYSSFKSFVGVLSSWQLAGTLSRRFGVTTLLRGAAVAAVVGSLLEAVSKETWLRLLQPLGWPTECHHHLLLLRGGHAESSSTSTPSLLNKACRDPSLFIYAALIFPALAAATQVLGIALRSRFTEVVPRSDTASALASVDVLLSATGVVAPFFGGVVFDGLEPQRQPLVAAALNGAVLLVIFACTRVARRGEAPRGKPHKAAEAKSA